MAIAAAPSRQQTSAEALLTHIRAAARADAEDAAELRRVISHSGIGAGLAERLIEIDRCLTWAHPDWQEVYVETLAPVFLTNSDAGGYAVDDDAATRLERTIGGDPTALSAGAVRLCLRLFLRADHLPDRLHNFVLAVVRHGIMTDQHFLRTEGQRRAGSLDILDVQLLRKLIYGPGGQYPVDVDRRAATFLLDLHFATRSGRQTESWRELLCQGIADYVMPSGTADPGRRAWLTARLRSEAGDATIDALLRRLVDPQPPDQTC